MHPSWSCGADADGLSYPRRWLPSFAATRPTGLMKKTRVAAPGVGGQTFQGLPERFGRPARACRVAAWYDRHWANLARRSFRLLAEEED